MDVFWTEVLKRDKSDINFIITSLYCAYTVVTICMIKFTWPEYNLFSRNKKLKVSGLESAFNDCAIPS